MERELYDRLERALRVIPERRPPRAQYTDHDIARVVLWAALHDRPVCWACDRSNWPGRRVIVPDASTVSRRSRRLGVLKLLRGLSPRGRGRDASLLCVDGKPLLVGRFSKDRQARFGHADGGMRRGYRLHAVCDRSGNIRAFCVRTLNDAECVVARKLLSRAASRGSIVLGDAGYDANPLYEMAASRGARLIAPRRKAGRSISEGHRQHADRLRAIELLEGDARKRRQASRLRSAVERSFGWLTMLGGGSPPPWIRTLRRVRLWVLAKLAIHHAAIQARR